MSGPHNIERALTDPIEGRVLGWGDTVGNGVENWATSALFLHTDGTSGARVYVNMGTTASATWNDIADVGIADAASLITATTVEGALQELARHIRTTQGFIDFPLNTWREASNFDVGAIAANGGILASDTTPILSAINDATDGCQRIQWAASNNDQIINQFMIPYDLDTSYDMQLNVRIASGGTTDAVGFTVDTFFSEGDTKVTDTTATNQTTSYANKAATIAAADVAGRTNVTIGLTPVAHTTDTMNCTAIFLKYQRKTLTS